VIGKRRTFSGQLTGQRSNTCAFFAEGSPDQRSHSPPVARPIVGIPLSGSAKLSYAKCVAISRDGKRSNGGSAARFVPRSICLHLALPARMLHSCGKS
jgi:hypothetical protein